MALKGLGLTGQLQGYIAIRSTMSAIISTRIITNAIISTIIKIIKTIFIINIVLVKIDMFYSQRHHLPP